MKGGAKPTIDFRIILASHGLTSLESFFLPCMLSTLNGATPFLLENGLSHLANDSMFLL